MKVCNSVNNNWFNFTLSGSLEYAGVLLIAEEEKMLSTTSRIEGSELFFSQGTARICVDANNKSVKWVKHSLAGASTFYYVGSKSGSYVFTSEEGIILFDQETEECTKKSLDGEHLSAIIGDYIVTFKFDDEILSVRDYYSLDVKWRFKMLEGIPGEKISDNSLLVTYDDDYIDTFKIDTGDLFWKIEYKTWIEDRFPDEITIWKKMFIDPTSRRYSSIAPGPLIDNIQYFCWCNHVTALDALTGEELWSWKIPNDSEHVGVPRNPPIYRNGKLYILKSAGRGENTTFLYCLDAKNGALVYQTDPGTFVVMGEGMRSFMAGDDYITTSGTKVVAYNVEKREISWKYDDKTPVFDGYVLPYPTGLCVVWREVNKLFWYESKT